MIKFFRKIRQRLLSENKFSKYLIYAIGEIVLVVIGILIALQINNWNELQRSKAQEERLIHDLHIEYQQNHKELLVDIKRVEVVNEASIQLLKLMQQSNINISEKELNSLISKALSSPTWNPSFFVMEELKKSSGFAQLSNTELKKALLDWERYYGNLREVENGFKGAYIEMINFLIEEGSIRDIDYEHPGFDIGKSILPNRNLALLKNYKFENHLDNMYVTSIEELNRYYIVLEKIEAILNLSNIKEQ